MKRLVFVCILFSLATLAHAQPPDCRREPVHFSSGSFELLGDFLVPPGSGRRPVIVYVWGAGPSNRARHIEQSPVLKMFLDHGYAVLLYDKPGSGGSTGEIASAHQFAELAAILLDAIEVVKARDDVDARSIGLYGSSQASYVMATALSKTSDVAFVIGWSCPMQNSIEQGAFLVRHYVLCDGGSEELAGVAADAYRRRATARSYEEYRAAAEALNQVAAIRDGLGWAGPVAPESDFTPADATSESFFDPSATFAALKIPLLALYAENDRQIDPVQGAEWLRKSFATGGRSLSSVAIVPGADHNMNLSPRGCMQDQRDDYRAVGGRTLAPAFTEAIGSWLERLHAVRATADR